jgi:hypothetical protein
MKRLRLAGGRGAGGTGSEQGFARSAGAFRNFKPGGREDRSQGRGDRRLEERQRAGVAQTAAMLGRMLMEMLGGNRRRLRANHSAQKEEQQRDSGGRPKAH